MDAFKSSIAPLKIELYGSDIGEIGETLEFLVHLSEIMVSYEVPSMNDGYESSFSDIYHQYLLSQSRDHCKYPEGVIEAAHMLNTNYENWYSSFVSTHF